MRRGRQGPCPYTPGYSPDAKLLRTRALGDPECALVNTCWPWLCVFTFPARKGSRSHAGFHPQVQPVNCVFQFIAHHPIAMPSSCFIFIFSSVSNLHSCPPLMHPLTQFNINPCVLRRGASSQVGTGGGRIHLPVQEVQETGIRSLGPGSSPGVGNGNPASVLARRIPWAEEPGSRDCKVSETTRAQAHTSLENRLCSCVWFVIYINGVVP